jgi:hypothetical protein
LSITQGYQIEKLLAWNQSISASNNKEIRNSNTPNLYARVKSVAKGGCNQG